MLSTLLEYNLTDIVGTGWIATVPWQSHGLPLNAYPEEVRKIVNQSLILHNNFLTKWNDSYHNGKRPSFYSGYGYDAVYTLAYAIQYIEDHPNEYDGQNILDIIRNKEASEIIELLNGIITSKIDFIGVSGRVSFDENGDRLHGFFSFRNIVSDGKMNYVGYFYMNVSDGTISHQLNVSKIHWPSAFVEKGIIPHTDIITYEEMISLPVSASVCTVSVSLLSIIYAACCICLSIHYRQHKVIRAVSWRFNIVICMGAILGYTATIIYSIDEVFLDDTYILGIACNVRIWVTTIAFTLLFMPLFAKPYRLS
eukprot:1001153_1